MNPAMHLSSDALHERAKALEDAFFFERDRELIAQLERKYTAEETEKLLATATGIADKLALKEVTGVQAGVQVLAAMALLPLVEVAWCDGTVAASEKAAILKAAQGLGIAADSRADQLLHNWLDRRPSAEAVSKWKEYVRAICATLKPETVAKLKQGVIDRAATIAQAAGGILGFGDKISAAERTKLSELAQAFDSPISPR